MELRTTLDSFHVNHFYFNNNHLFNHLIIVFVFATERTIPYPFHFSFFVDPVGIALYLVHLLLGLLFGSVVDG